MSTTQPQSPLAAPETKVAPSRWRLAMQAIVQGNGIISVLAVLIAVVVGSIMIAATNEEVQTTAGYFFARPMDMIGAVWDAVAGAYAALFRGAIYNFNADSFAIGIRPLTETLKFATPLIAAGLGVGLAFRAGLFNIGGQGQMLMAAAAGGYVATQWDLPMGLHLIAAIVAGMIAGAIWAGIAGLLKARTGAHEVITTIMLNHIAFYLLAWMLATQGILQAPGSSNPKTAPMPDTAVLPQLLGPQYKLHAGFLLALVAVAFTWWLLERSSLGFRFRAVGENPAAARVAGIDVGRMYLVVMLIAGALVGIAGISQILGTETSGFGGAIDAGIGFDAITVALLGRSSPLGILAAGLLFGAFKTGGFTMQSSQGIPIEIVLVVQSLIVLFIAAPPLVRAMFGLPQPGARKKPKKPKKNAAQIAEEVSA
ncbi:ABC transporter permease [Microbacterium sp. YMB-B2]|uniref:ABC transporter permease n=1 Tax=Microbacterium tenebrionis TaxID=2830665 RepID=A0A9X1S1C7_9MICO|nr:ABC transporter permease [Microbacterium tenebrionis]MCC2030132.1 ABC transporter permease [Microbacterium tenebrionis]